jgi:fatty acid amide hydrolase
MARSVGDLVLMVKAWLSPQSSMYLRDPTLAPVHFGNDGGRGSKSRLRVGYFVFDGWFECAEACARAVEQAREALQNAGHELVPFQVPDPYEYVRLYISVISADGHMRNLRSGLEGEDLLPEYSFMSRVSKMPLWLRNSLVWLHATILGNERVAHVLKAGKSRDAYEFWNIARDVQKYRYLFVASMEEQGLDALLCPGGTLPALPHGESSHLSLGASTTFLFNLLHLPAGTVPITRVRKDEEERLLSSEASRHRPDQWTKRAEQSLRDSAGLPIGVQVAARPWHDELVLELMQQIEERIGFSQEQAFLQVH